MLCWLPILPRVSPPGTAAQAIPEKNSSCRQRTSQRDYQARGLEINTQQQCNEPAAEAFWLSTVASPASRRNRYFAPFVRVFLTQHVPESHNVFRHTSARMRLAGSAFPAVPENRFSPPASPGERRADPHVSHPPPRARPAWSPSYNPKAARRKYSAQRSADSCRRAGTNSTAPAP